MAEQKLLPTGWIEGSKWVPWSGGSPPAPEEAVVFVQYNNGTCLLTGRFVRAIHWGHGNESWRLHVVAYYLVTNDVATLTAAPFLASAPPPPALAAGVAPAQPQQEK